MTSAATTSWKTTLGGILAAVGAAVLGAKAALGYDPPEWLLLFGLIAGAVGPVLLGGAARDANKSSQDHRIRK